MSRHDGDISDDFTKPLRKDLNSWLDATASTYSGEGDDVSTSEYKLIVDTTTSTVRMRDGSNTSWNTVGTADVANMAPLVSSSRDIVASDFSKSLLCNSGSGQMTLQLPLASTLGQGFWFDVKKIDPSLSAVVIKAQAGELIDDFLTATIFSQNQSLSILCTGTGYVIRNKDVSKASDTLSTVENHLINGDFNLWKRGKSLVNFSGSTYLADRFRNLNSSSALLDISRSTDVPGVDVLDHGFKYSMEVEAKSFVTPSSGEMCAIEYFMTGYDWKSLRTSALSVIFAAKTTLTGVYSFVLRNDADDFYYVEDVSLTAGSWEKVQFVIPSPPSGVWNFDENVGLHVQIVLDAGTKDATSGTWTSGTVGSSSSQASFLGAGNVFNITGVQIANTSLLAPYIHVPSHINRRNAARYLTKSYDDDVDPGTVTFDGSISFDYDTSSYNSQTYFEQRMFRKPSIFKIYSTFDGALGFCDKSGVNDAATSTPSQISTRSSGVINVTSGSGNYRYHYLASAEYNDA